jgi:hypothetical protein
VSAILTHYRDLYTPATGSPLIGAGDPAGSPKNNIGAIGQGADVDPSDQFGTFRPGFGGPPPLNLPDAGASRDARNAGGAGGNAGGADGSEGGASGGAGGSTAAGAKAGCGCELGRRTRTHSSAVPWLLLVVVALRRWCRAAPVDRSTASRSSHRQGSRCSWHRQRWGTRKNRDPHTHR